MPATSRGPFSPPPRSPYTGEICNLGAGNPQSVNRLVELIGGDVVYIPKRPGEPDVTLADIGKITRELGWQPRVTFRGGGGADDGRDRQVARRAAVGSRPRSRRATKTLVRPSRTRTADRHDDDFAHERLPPQDQERATSCARSSARTRARRRVIMCHGVFDLVHPGHIRHLLYAKTKADILVASLTADTPHHQGEVPAVRAAGSARAQPRGAGDGRLRRDRRERDPARQHLAGCSPTISPRATSTSDGGVHPRTQQEIDAIEAYGGEMLFTPGDIVYSSSALIESGPPNISTREAADADGGATASTSTTCDKVSTSSRRQAVHVVGDTIVDSLTYTTMIGGMTKTPTLSVRFDSRAGLHRRRRDRRASIWRAAGAEVTFSTVLGDDPHEGFRSRRAGRVRGRGARRSSTAPGRRRNKNAIVCGGYRLLKVDTLDNRSISDHIVRDASPSRLRRRAATRWCSATSATASSTAARSRR